MTRLLNTIFGCTLAVLSFNSKAATFGLESLDVIVGASEVTVAWYFENSAENVGDLFVDVSFDDTLLTPRTTVQEIIPGTGIFVDVPDGCLDGVSGIADTACVLIAPNAIRISLSSTPQVIPSQDTGSLTFDLAPSLSDGDSVTLSLTLADLLPADADVTLVDGVLNFNDAPPGVLEVSPLELDFGSVFLGQTSASLPVSICNTGGVDALDLTISSIDIAPVEFAQGAGGNCDAEPFDLASGACCTYTVRYSPAAEGLVSGSMTVSIDAGDISNDSVSLSGLGVAPPTEIVFVESPDYAVIDGPFFGGVVVHVLDSNGNLFSDDSSTVVEMSLSADPSGIATLSGTTSVTVSGGVAVFPDLSIDQLGNGYVLRASDQADTLDAGDSEAFAVLPLELLQDRFEQD